MSFSGAGLGLDVVGAVLLLLGLFRHALPLYPGWSRSPVQAAEDRAYGTTGAAFFVTGFTLQLFGSAGFGSHCQATVLLSGLVAVVGGALAAYMLFGLAF